MDNRIRIVAAVGAVAFSVMVLTSPTDPIAIPAPDTGVRDDSVTVLAVNLDMPRAIAVSEDRVFVTEKTGQVRVVQNGTLLGSPLAVLRPAEAFDGGLIGIATHPDFEENHLLYVFLTYDEDGGLWNKILRITESDNKLQSAQTVLDGIPGSPFTNGGFLKFGPDGKLYAGTGTPSEASHLPQDLGSLAGKILRINDDGSIPDDNPFEGSPVYSLGHRNPQGIAWDSQGRMFAAEIGPEKNDEINVIVPGGNYGWPEAECSGGGRFVSAVLCYDPSIEPSGILFYTGSRLSIDEEFIMASLRASNLYQLDVEEGLPSQKSILSGIGRIRDAVQADDGSIYVITSNTDGRGFPAGTDDILLRILK